MNRLTPVCRPLAARSQTRCETLRHVGGWSCRVSRFKVSRAYIALSGFALFPARYRPGRRACGLTAASSAKRCLALPHRGGSARTYHFVSRRYPGIAPDHRRRSRPFGCLRRPFQPGESRSIRPASRMTAGQLRRAPGRRRLQSCWMPASWSRPKNKECSAYSIPRVRCVEKLGLAATSQAGYARTGHGADAFAADCTSIRGAPECAIKPVMSNAENSLCAAM